jgi:hypothetical protein
LSRLAELRSNQHLIGNSQTLDQGRPTLAAGRSCWRRAADMVAGTQLKAECGTPHRLKDLCRFLTTVAGNAGNLGRPTAARRVLRHKTTPKSRNSAGIGGSASIAMERCWSAYLGATLRGDHVPIRRVIVAMTAVVSQVLVSQVLGAGRSPLHLGGERRSLILLKREEHKHIAHYY